MTSQREAILDILISRQDEHLNADEIYIATKNQFPDIGLATVYRTLDLFSQLDIINKLEFGDAGCRYEFNPNYDKHYHHHLICLKCGKINEVKDDSLDALEEKIAYKSGFKITDHSLRFYGYCKTCQKG